MKGINEMDEGGIKEMRGMKGMRGMNEMKEMAEVMKREGKVGGRMGLGTWE